MEGRTDGPDRHSTDKSQVVRLEGSAEVEVVVCNSGTMALRHTEQDVAGLLCQRFLRLPVNAISTAEL
jgi:hypothetical protein